MKYNIPKLPQTLPEPVKWGLRITAGILTWKYVVHPILGYIGIVPSKAESDFEKQTRELSKIYTNDGSTTPNITELEAKEIANTLYMAMDKFGTDFNTMTGVLKNLNGKGLQLVYKAFGVPKYFGTGRGEYFGTAQSLFQWFGSELQGGQLDEMRYLWGRSGLKF